MRASVFVALSVVLVSSCKPSDPPSPSPSSSAAPSVTEPPRRGPSAAAESLPAPSLHDAQLALRRAGYHGGTTSRTAGEEPFEIRNVTGPDGLVAEIRVIKRQPSPDSIEADLRARGALMVARKGGVWLTVIVQRGGKVDAPATSEMLEAVIEATGAAPRTVVVQPPSKPAWSIRDALTGPAVRALLTRAGYEVKRATAEQELDKRGTEGVTVAEGEGTRGDHRLTFHLACAPAQFPTMAEAPGDQEAGSAAYVDGLCIAAAALQVGAAEVSPELSQKALLELLKTPIAR